MKRFLSAGEGYGRSRGSGSPAQPQKDKVFCVSLCAPKVTGILLLVAFFWLCWADRAEAQGGDRAMGSSQGAADPSSSSEEIRSGTVIKSVVFLPIEGARILWETTTESVYTDAKGRFVLPSHWNGGTLLFSAHGYETRRYELFDGGLRAGNTQILLYPDVSWVMPVHIGDTLPDQLWDMPFEVINHPAGRTRITLREYHETHPLILLNFWATWCAPCVRSLDEWNRGIVQIPSGAGLLGVHVGRQTDRVPAFIKERGWQFPVIVGENRALSKLFFPKDNTVGFFVYIKDGRLFAVPHDKSFSADLMSGILQGTIDRIPSDDNFMWKGGVR